MPSIVLLCCLTTVAPPADSGYAIVVSEDTAGDAEWARVVETLKQRYGAKVITYDKSADASLPELKQQFPRYTCFVARPTEATKGFVATVHQLARKLDDDPYTDTRWGILTGYDAAGALKIARHKQPLEVRKVASGTEIAMQMVCEGVWYCELQQHHMVEKNPKVYLPIGNCLMGNIDGPHAMALAWMHSAGVHQMIGYTVPTWFGYGGWGCLDYFLEQPGRYTFAEAFHANHHALVYGLEKKGGNQRGMQFDRDVVAFFGDPAWEARMADRPKAYEQELTVEDGVFTLTISGNRGEESFRPVNTNGSQRGWRPIVQFLPYRVRDVEIVEDSGLEPMITDDFMLVPNPRQYESSKSYVVTFRAKPMLSPAETAEAQKPARPVTVLLVAPDALAEAWQPFGEWKTRLGKATRIVTLSEIDAQFEGDDIQRKIRACCLEYIDQHGTRWVILGGDSQPNGKGLVPDRDTVHDCRFARFNDIPTDIYYISEKNWDANDDDVYGDWKKDITEIAYTNPRASIGRIPVRTARDVTAYTAKVIAYESNYPATGFARKLVYTCPEPGAYPKLRTSRDTLNAAWKSCQIMQFFGNKTPWDKDVDGDHDLTPENWVNMINDKAAGKIHMHGHGFLPVWVLEGQKTVNAKHVGKLTNANAYLAMTTVSCFTGQYDAVKDPSISESMLRKADGGAVVVIAPSRQGVPVFHDPARDFRLMLTQGKMDGTTETLTRFWQHALTKNLTAGEALSAAKADMADDAMKAPGYHFLQCELNLLGDPTLDLRAADPKTALLKKPKSIGLGKQTVNVSTDVPGATVCLWKDDELYEVLTCDDVGDATCECVTKSTGQILVSVSGPSYNAVLDSIDVIE